MINTGTAVEAPVPPGLLRSAALIVILSGLTIAMGFLVQVVLAAKLGASREMDAYFVAITLPTAITAVSLVTFAPVMVPVLKQRLSSGGMQEARETFFQVHNLLGLLMLPVVAVIILGARPVIRLAAPGFDPQTVDLAAGLLQIMIIGAFFDTLRGLQSAFYYSQERFFLPQFVPIVNHFIILLSVLFLLDRLGLPGLALGWTAGSLAMFLLLFFGPVGGPQFRLKFDLQDPGLRRVGALLVPAAMVALLSQATPFVDRLVASLLPSGSISYLGYGSKMLEILMRTVPMGVGLAIFPVLSDHAARKEWGKLSETMATALRWIVLGSLPLATAAVILREPLVALAFQRGAFDEVATLGVAEALGWYALALIPASLVHLFHRVFYALQDLWMLLRLGGLGLAGTVLLDIALSRLLGFSGIAIAFLSISIVLATIMAILVKGRLAAFPASQIIRLMGQATVAALVMGGVMAGLGRLMGTGSEGMEGSGLYILGSLLLGTGAYLLVLRMMGNPEIRLGEALLRERVGGWPTIPSGSCAARTNSRMEWLRRLFRRPDFRRNPLRGIWRRLVWRVRWKLTADPWHLRLGTGLTIAVPRSGAGALLYYQGFSEPETSDFILRFLRPGMMFLDIGAHFGEYTLLGARAIGPSGMVHAFEPHPDIFQLLSSNVRANGLSNVVLNQTVVSDIDGEREFQICVEPAMSLLKEGGYPWGKKILEVIKVPSVRLDTYWTTDDRRIDLAKIDVEGAEILVFQGARRMLQLPEEKAPVWVFEWAPQNWSAFGYGPDDLLALLNAHGYRLWRYDASGKLLEFRGDWFPGQALNVIAGKEEARLRSMLGVR